MFIDARHVLARHQLQPKHSFGQNFLIAQTVVENIAQHCVHTQPTTVVEIGAGVGTLTSALLTLGAQVFAIERDRDLIPILQTELNPYILTHQLTVIEDDAVSIDWSILWSQGQGPYVLAGNLPYQITGRLIERAVQYADQISHAVFMLQREVADRLMAQPATKTYGQLSVFTQARFDIRRIRIVNAGSFYPRPRIESAVVILTPRIHPRANETACFQKVVHAAFHTRRKTLFNALSSVFSRAQLSAAASKTSIDLNRRGETLSVEEFASLAEALA